MFLSLLHKLWRKQRFTTKKQQLLYQHIFVMSEKTMYTLMYSFKAYLETGLDDLWCDLSYKFTVRLTSP